MTFPDQPVPVDEPVAPEPAAPQQPVPGQDGDIPNVNPGTPDGTEVVGPGMPDEPGEKEVDPTAAGFYENMTGIARLQYNGDEPITMGTLRLSKGDVLETSNANVAGILSGDNGSNFQRV